jgi:hypothetical protein
MNKKMDAHAHSKLCPKNFGAGKEMESVARVRHANGRWWSHAYNG